ncbi:MAG: hypothetical protein A3J35_04160 [Gammaproteobacteria bacterium RIFCSPLOWO2_02_FULL_52_10]|nr:MAG: hypothetical protein A3J35_04160 [Gammaproteobacteria bacterium RIFCSPLOWO2_02_FULL_52_10]
MNQILNPNQPGYTLFILSHEWHATVIRFLVGILLITIYFWILEGTASLLIQLYFDGFSGWPQGAEAMIKKVVIMLAAFELIRTLQSYLILGRVKVTFILDAALVVLIGELLSLWYGGHDATQVVTNLTVIALLTVLRIITTKYSPDLQDDK